MHTVAVLARGVLAVDLLTMAYLLWLWSYDLLTMAVLVPTMAVFEKLQVGAPTTIVEHTLLL